MQPMQGPRGCTALRKCMQPFFCIIDRVWTVTPHHRRNPRFSRSMRGQQSIACMPRPHTMGRVRSSGSLCLPQATRAKHRSGPHRAGKAASGRCACLQGRPGRVRQLPDPATATRRAPDRPSRPGGASSAPAGRLLAAPAVQAAVDAEAESAGHGLLSTCCGEH